MRAVADDDDDDDGAGDARERSAMDGFGRWWMFASRIARRCGANGDER